MRLLLFMGFAISLHPQITGGVGYSAAAPLQISNVFTENFDATTPSSQWTIGSDLTPGPGPALSWYSTGGNPGFRFANYGHGGASAPWAVGTGAFNLSFNQMWSSGIVPGAAGISYQAAIPTLNGAAVCVSTDPLGSQTSNTWNICYQANQAGIMIDVRQGIPYYLQAVGTITGGNTFARNNGDFFTSAMIGQQFWLTANGTLTDTGPYAITGVPGNSALTFSPSAPNNSTYSMHGDMVLTKQLDSGLSTGPPSFPFPTFSIPWFIGQSLINNPMLQVAISRTGNTITWNLYTCPMTVLGTAATGIQAALQLGGGATPIGVGQIYNLIGGNTAVLTGSAASASFQYVNVVNVNSDHTGWLGGGSSPAGSPIAPAGIYTGSVSNIHGYGAVSSGALPTVTSVLPAATSGTANLIQTGNAITITGSNLNAGSTIRIGVGPNLQTASTTFVSNNQLTAILPPEANAVYKFSLVDPSGADIPVLVGINYSGVTITRMDPHEWSTAGGDAITVTGAGFDANTSLTIAGSTCANVALLDSQHLTCTVPSGSPGIPTVTLTSTAGSFISSSTDPVLLKGYANHPYLQFNSSGLTALRSKWTNPTYADYTAPIKRDVSIAVYLTAVSGTFSVGDAITQGNATGICYGYHYGFMVISPTSGVFTTGAFNAPSGAGTIAVIGSIPGMQTSFTAAVSGVNGVFHVGDIVTQGINSGIVYSYGGGVLGIMPISGAFGIPGNTATLTGPSGSAALSLSHVPNSPNDGPSAAWGGWEINTWQNYAWYDVLSGSPVFDSALWNGTGLLAGADSLSQELGRISWLDHWDQYFSLESGAAPVAQFYDMNWASLTQSEKTSILTYLDRVRVVCNVLSGNNDTFVVPTGSSWNNWFAISNGSCLQVHLAEMNSVYTVTHGGASADVVHHVNNMRGISPNYTNGYINREMDPDGVVLEGSQYTGFGLTSYLLAGKACLNATGNDTCGAAGTGLLSMPHIANQATQYDLTLDGAGGWQTFNDTEPQLYDVQIMADMGDRVQNPTLLYIGDSLAHRIAVSDGFAGMLNWQASRDDYASWAFVWRSSSTAAFGGVDTAEYAPAQSYAVLRSSGAFQPNLVVGIKGQSSDMALNGHRESDAGSFVVQSRGQLMLIDPGYNQASAAAHSIFSVDGNSVQTGNSAFTTAWDTGSLLDDGGAKESIAIDIHGVFGTGVSQARRTFATYADKALIILDDIIPTGPGTVVSNFQAGFPVTRSGSPAGITNTIVGPASSLACSFNGPSVTPRIAGPIGFGGSWVYANLQVQWYTFSASYTATSANPLVTVCVDSQSGLSYNFSNLGRQIIVAFSDATRYTFDLIAGQWKLEGRPPRRPPH